MNPTTVTTQTSPTATGAAALTGAVAGEPIIWLCQVLHLEPLPDAITASIMAAALVTLIHWIANRFPSKSMPVVTAVPPGTPSATPVVQMPPPAPVVSPTTFSSSSISIPVASGAVSGQ